MILMTPAAYALPLGWVSGSPSAVATLRAKVRGRPNFVMVLAGSALPDGNIKLMEPFSSHYDTCGRGAEIRLRVDFPIQSMKEPLDKVAKAFHGNFLQLLEGICSNDLDLVPQSLADHEKLRRWAKATKAAFRIERRLTMQISPIALDDKSGDLFPKKVAKALLSELDGLSILFSDVRHVGTRYRPLLAGNLIWANEMAAGTGKIVTFILSGAQHVNFGNTSPAESLAETIAVLKGLAPKALPQLCTGKVQLAFGSTKLTDVTQDKQIAEIEKWMKQYCGVTD